MWRQARGNAPEKCFGVSIRPLRDTDVEVCAAIMLELPLWQRYGTTPEEARALFTAALTGSARARVAEDRGRVIGFVVYSLRGTFDRSGYVRAVGVAAGAQGRGTGDRLMRAAEEDILSHGPNVFLLVSAGNADARRFYERRGYRWIGEIPDYVRAGITEALYRKTLGPIRPE
jgi:ribosomal protein S18 acetylase RimI-like enzyme